MDLTRRLQCLLLLLVVTVAVPAAASEDSAALEHGYRLMYGLDFASAGQVFRQWRTDHPRDPIGPMSEAANLLFAELNRTGVLQTQFFVDNSSFTSNKPQAPSPEVRARFDAAAADAETMARARLREAPHDPNALFAMAMVFGLRADFAGLLEGRNMAALEYGRQASRSARTLLAVDPDYADAYLATGINYYIVGSLSPPLRWILRLAGFEGDKDRGMRELKLTAEHGRLLGPFARILLAIAYLRHHDKGRARELLAGLAREFPSNPLFARELERLDGRVH
jgi:hypothetical protein